MIERTLVLIKPDGVFRGLIGEILARFEKTGLKIVGLKMVWADKKFAEEHYKAHRGKKFFDVTVDYVTQGPIVAMAIEGVHAIQNVRKMVGSTSPHDALPGTIRGDFAHLSLAYADANKKGGRNLIHASDKPETAAQEISLWFKDDELHSYRSSHEDHVL
ncbi:MAG: nucleoside diphosphate kinase, nucleoside-diphosphate kinase [archaeon GW2011_AR3]|nr:MAG: nucleoside diphosphate kinase, nucleoside-diphosphate kinase [archaeon GW2011_AR3]MBS3110052.1 nucleoside-diphosphate kinase [Candidatus Woesearchaeota archaeon]